VGVGLQDAKMSQPTCPICKLGDLLPGTTTVTLVRANTTLVVKSVPALVCENCGEEYAEEAVTNDLLDLLGRAERDGVQVDIREYIAA
jgi:YgiT-type zinc finger domain-containing protein